MPENTTTVVVSDTIKLDSLSIIPQSFKAFDSHGNILDVKDYLLIFESATLIIKSDKILHQDSIMEFEYLPQK